MTLDAIIIGGGHNGLTAAAYLGKAGMKVLVLERRAILGGAAVTEEFAPGYRNSIASYTVSLLRPEVIDELNLKHHGYEPIPTKGYLNLFSDGEAMLLTGDETRDRAAYARHSNSDYDAMLRFYAAIDRVGSVLRAQWLRPPPPLGGGLFDMASLLPGGRAFLKLPADDRHFLAQFFAGSASSIVDRTFKSARIRNKFAGHCISSSFSSMDAPGSALPFFQNTLGEFEGVRGKWGIARGGMGAITQAMAAAGRTFGVDFRVSSTVNRIVIENSRAAGVTLEDGTEFRAPLVLANSDPKRTFLNFVGPENLPGGFAAGIKNLRFGHASLRINLALSEAPCFAALSKADNEVALASAIYLYPARPEVETSYRAAMDGDVPETPYINAMVPSSLDDSLAPPGHHVMSLLCKYYPYHLKNGENWDGIREKTADRIIEAFTRHVPNLKSSIVARQVLSPMDLERIFGLTEGDIFHGRHDLDQIFSLRPHPEAAQYRTPIAGLYLCGAGTHPGGGVSGAPGRNAAQQVLKDWRRGW